MIPMELCRANEGVGGVSLTPTIVSRFEVETEEEAQDILSQRMVNRFFYRRMDGGRSTVAAVGILTRRVAILERLINEIAELCDGRADADCTGDPPRYVPNFAMQLLTMIREVVPR